MTALDHNEIIYIDKECRLFFSSPIWCDSVCTGIQPAHRHEHLIRACDFMNSIQDSYGLWAYKKILNPRTIRNRKVGYIEKNIQLGLRIINEIRTVLDENELMSVEARVSYVDYGLGTFEIAISIRKSDEVSFKHFFNRCCEVKNIFVTYLQNGAKNTTPSLSSINKELSAFIEEETRAIPNQLNTQYREVENDKRTPFCGPIARHITFYQKDSKEGALRIQASEIESASHIFMDQCTCNKGITGSKSIPIYHVGYEGSVLLLNNNELLSHVEFLWSWTIIYWAALLSASEGMYAISTKYSVQGKYSLNEINKNLDLIEMYRKIISMIKFEFRPENVVVEGEDTIIYSKQWHAYKSEELFKSVNQMDADCGMIVSSLSQKSESISQKKVRNLFGLLTGISFIDVLASIISFYDVNSEIQAIERIKLVGSSGGLLLLVGLAYFGLVKYSSRYLKQ